LVFRHLTVIKLTVSVVVLLHEHYRMFVTESTLFWQSLPMTLTICSSVGT